MSLSNESVSVPGLGSTQGEETPKIRETKSFAHSTGKCAEKLADLWSSFETGSSITSMGVTRNLFSIPKRYEGIPPLLLKDDMEEAAILKNTETDEDREQTRNKPFYQDRAYTLEQLVETMESWKFRPLPAGQMYLCSMADVAERGPGIMHSSLFCDQIVSMEFGRCLEQICNTYNSFIRREEGMIETGLGKCYDRFRQLNCSVMDLYPLMTSEEASNVSDSLNTLEFCFGRIDLLGQTESALSECMGKAIYQLGRCLQVLGAEYIAPITARENALVYQVLYSGNILQDSVDITKLVTDAWEEAATTASDA